MTANTFSEINTLAILRSLIFKINEDGKNR